MNPIQVELSPGSEVKRRPVLDARTTKNDYTQRTSRDAYYYRADSDCRDEESAGFANTTEPSEATMLERELDAILRGDKTTATRQRSVHRETVRLMQETSPSLQPPPPPLTAIQKSQHSCKAGAEPTQKEPEVTHVPELTQRAPTTNSIGSSSCSSGSKGGKLPPSPQSVSDSGDHQRGRQSAMRYSIDRFFSASEEREEGGEAEQDRRSASPPDHRAGSGASTIFSPPPRVPQVENDAEASVDTAADVGVLSRSLFDGSKCHSADACPSSCDRSSANVSRFPPSPNEGPKFVTQQRSALQSVPVNAAISLSSQRARKGGHALASATSQPSASRAAVEVKEKKDKVTPTAKDADRMRTSVTSAFLLNGAEVVVTCEACQLALKLFVFFPAASSSPVAFCPLCGSKCAAVSV